MEMTLDHFDRQILKILSDNSRLAYAEIGRKISLSQSATKERIQNLIDEGIIKKFSVEVDYQKLGFGLRVIINLKFINDDFKRFISSISKFPEIVQCQRMTGEYCITADCVLRDSSHLTDMIDRLINYGIPSSAIQLSEIETGNFFS